MERAMSLKSLQEWRDASGGEPLFIGRDVVIEDAHICEYDGRHMIIPFRIHDIPSVWYLKAHYQWKPWKYDNSLLMPESVDWVIVEVLDDARFKRLANDAWEWGDWGYCPCNRIDVIACDTSKRSLTNRVKPTNIEIELQSRLSSFGVESRACEIVGFIACNTFYFDSRGFDLCPGVPSDIPPYSEWASDKPVRSATIWDYWFINLRPLIQSKAVTIKDIRRDRRIDGQRSKTNFGAYLNARGHDWRHVLKAWDAGKEYCFRTREAISFAEEGEVVPPTERPLGWNPRNGTRRTPP